MTARTIQPDHLAESQNPSASMDNLAKLVVSLAHLCGVNAWHVKGHDDAPRLAPATYFAVFATESAVWIDRRYADGYDTRSLDREKTFALLQQLLVATSRIIDRKARVEELLTGLA